MHNTLKEFFKLENIEFYGSFPISSVAPEELVSPRRLPDFAKTVTVFLIPYRADDSTERNISLYAVPRDYHLYIKQLEKRFYDHLAEKNISGLKAAFFADTSPFDERSLAKKARLGFVGKNGLLINQKYGSYCFIGELVTDLSECVQGLICDKSECDLCGKCKTACPGNCFSKDGGQCVSHLTQKKQLDENELELVKAHPYVWGCDICQQVCPHNESVANTPISFFKQDRIPYLDSDVISRMSDEEFSMRAYSWRGRAVIERNISFKTK